MQEHSEFERHVNAASWKRAGLTACLFALFGIIFYAVTAPHTAYPGYSAVSIGELSGLDVAPDLSRPLFRFLAPLWAGCFKSLGTAFGFNLLAALLGGFLLGAIPWCVWFWVYRLIGLETESEGDAKAATLAGIATGLAMLFSLPIWTASTRFNPAIADLAAFTLAFILLSWYTRSEKWIWLALASLILGVASAESLYVLLPTPLVILFAGRIEWIIAGDRIRPSFWRSIMLAPAGYLADHGWAIYQGVSANSIQDTFSTAIPHVIEIIRSQYYTFLSFFEHGYIPILATSFVLMAVVILFCHWTFQGEVRRSILFLGPILSLIACYALYNATGTAWMACGETGRFPVWTAASACIAFGFMAAYWRVLPTLVTGNEESDFDEDEGPSLKQSAFRQKVSQLILALLMSSLAISSIFNLFRYRKHDGDFADFAANRILENREGRDWIFSDGILDANLLILAHDRGEAIQLFSPYRANDHRYIETLTTRLKKSLSEHIWLRAEPLLHQNLILFMEELFASMSEIHTRLICLQGSDLWHSIKLLPKVETFFVGGIPADRKAQRADRETLVAIWNEIADLMAIESEKAPFLPSEKLRNALRRKISLEVNNYGTELEDQGEENEAFEIYQLACRFNPDNVSALLNLVHLAEMRTIHPEQLPAFQKRVLEIVKDRTLRYPLWALSRHCGYIRNYKVFQGRGLTWACSSSPASTLETLRQAQNRRIDPKDDTILTFSLALAQAAAGNFDESLSGYREILDKDPKNLAAISGTTRILYRQGKIQEALTVLENSAKAGLSQLTLRSEWALYYLMNGDFDRALPLVSDPELWKQNPAMVSILGFILLKRGELDQVENVILPKMDKLLTGTDVYFTHLLRGQLNMAKGPSHYKNARAFFHRALQNRPDVHAILDEILKLDCALDDYQAAEITSLRILRNHPEHAHANYVIGTLRLSTCNLAEADHYLAEAIKHATNFFEAYNNYAEVLIRRSRFDHAREIALKATEMAPRNGNAWAVLADAQIHMGQKELAKASIAKAHELNPIEIRYAFIDARIAKAEHDRAGFDAAIQKLKGSTLSLIERQDLSELENWDTNPAPIQLSL